TARSSAPCSPVPRKAPPRCRRPRPWPRYAAVTRTDERAHPARPRAPVAGAAADRRLVAGPAPATLGRPAPVHAGPGDAGAEAADRRTRRRPRIAPAAGRAVG